MYTFSEDISKADNKIIATADIPSIQEGYHFCKLSYPNICIPNRGLAWSLSFKPEDSPEIRELESNVLEYNDYIDFLESIPGFVQFFLANNLCVSKKDVADKWSNEVADRIFNKGNYCFLTDISIIDGWMFDNTFLLNYHVSIDGYDISLPIGKNADAYPRRAGGYNVIWNYTDIGHDFCFYVWEILGARYRQNEDLENDCDDEITYSFDAYDQFRNDFVEPQLVRIFKKLEHLGFINSYTIVPDHEDPRWRQYGKSDGSIDCALINSAFLKNKLVMEQIELLLWTKPDELNEKSYFLTNSSNKQFLSNNRGALGGHKKLKIYGRLDCPSAAHFLEKGQYLQHRVFFENEVTALSAGYRPCGVCMKAAYQKWKSKNH